MSDIQSTLDCKVNKLEEEIRLLKEMSKHRHSENQCDFSDTSDSSEDISNLVQYAMKVIGFKPIEKKDVNRVKRMYDITDEEEAKLSCLKEFMRCELRMPTAVAEELLENIEKVWNSSEEDWNRLYVEFKSEKSVKVCYSYCKFIKNKTSQVMQFFPPEFREQYRTLDSIAYKLRKPDNTYETKFKTRIRFVPHGLILEKRHPEQRIWTRVSVQHLPPVDLQPVPQPSESASPPSERPRESKRPRSSPSTSPAARPLKNLKTAEGNHHKNVINDNI